MAKFVVYACDNDNEWKPTGVTYASVEDAIDDHGEENVRPIGDSGCVFALHEDDKDHTQASEMMIFVP